MQSLRDLEIFSRSKAKRSSKLLERAFETIFPVMKETAVGRSYAVLVREQILEVCMLKIDLLISKVDNIDPLTYFMIKSSYDSSLPDELSKSHEDLFRGWYASYRLAVRQLHDAAESASCTLAERQEYAAWKESDDNLEVALDEVLAQPEYERLRRRIEPLRPGRLTIKDILL